MAGNQIVINVDIGETRVALIESGIVTELHVERRGERNVVGDVYLGKVTRVLPGMNAAFVDIGLDRAAFLHVDDALSEEEFRGGGGTFEEDDTPDEGEVPEEGEGDGEPEAEAEKKPRPKPRPQRKEHSGPRSIRDLVREGQEVVVQVSKGPISTKGARVTQHISLPGRYVVYMPTVDHIGVSKRIGNEKERRRLREVIDSLKPERGGLIVRTLSEGLTKKQLKTDVAYLVQTWNDVTERRQGARGARLLYSELDVMLRTVRDVFGPEVDKIIIDEKDAHTRLVRFVEQFMPDRKDDVEYYGGGEPVFDAYGIEDEIGRALSRKVPLKSGGYLIIDQAEALTAIDVNTGRFVGKRDVEETVTATNIEAVAEIAYQLRLRNLGGLIVIDFIDMDRTQNRERVERALSEALRNDKAKTTTVRISELGLVEMTRKRTRESLGRTLFEPCFYCDGTGHTSSRRTVVYEILRQIRREKDDLRGYGITVNAHPAVIDCFKNEARQDLEEAQRRYMRHINLQARPEYHIEQFDLVGG
ncbi:MAG: Rne/Rng family ribonuclease [Myxococcales bacterium]|nr:Rne/Rng family ribonuclease [Myxococcales bacterium]